MMSLLHRVAAQGALIAAILPIACTGSIDSDEGGAISGNDPNNPGGPVGPGQVVSPEAAAGPRPLLRLNQREYNNTVRDLLGDDSRPADDFPPDFERDFVFRRADLVAPQDADVIRIAAESLAQRAVRNLSSVMNCDPATSSEDACADQFIQDFGRRAYRRPLTVEEAARLRTLYDLGRDNLELNFEDAIGLLIEAVLQAPAFLYHWEAAYEAPSLDQGVVRLGAYEIASRLSYFIWGSTPDATLLDAAAAGTLSTDAEIEAQVRRLLDDARAPETVAAFFDDWLELRVLDEGFKDPDEYPEYDNALKDAMREETANFVQDVVFMGTGQFETLLTATHSFVDGSLGNVYGLNLSGDSFQRTELDPSERIGFLTQPAFLAATGATDGSHPVRRGKAIFEKLLCGELPPPPDEVPEPKPASAGGTTRERFAEHGQEACATGCHGLMDPLGFAFEHYDGIGRYRTMDNGGVVDASGSYTVDGAVVQFSDAIDLSQQLASSASVRACFARQWMRFALSRHEVDADALSIEHAQAGFAAGGFNVRDLIVAVATSRSFRFRSPAIGEVLQ